MAGRTDEVVPQGQAAHPGASDRITFEGRRDVPAQYDEMPMKFHRLSILPLLLLSGCFGSSTGLSGEGPAVIRLQVSGGFAGVNYTLVVDGPGGTVVGETCEAGCDFQDGEVLATLSEEQAEYVSDLFRDAGIHGLDGTDFGVECCDQFYYILSFRDEAGTSSVRGNSEVFPSDLRDAVAQIHALYSGTLPIVVDQDGGLENWPLDWATIDEVSLQGDLLELAVHFSGGCATHDFNLVAWGGWMESFPVQIQTLLSHDGKDDPCDAVVTERLTFDLRPLQKAYEESYGVGQPGETTVIISLANPNPLSSLSGYQIDYVF